MNISSINLETISTINWSLFWEAASAIATTLAVIVALWQTKYANKKKAKLSFVENMTIVPMVPVGTVGHIPKNQYVGIDFTNIGNRKIILKCFWLELPNNIRAVIQPDATPIGIVSLPVELDIEENIFLPWSRSKFGAFLKDENALPRNQRLTFYVEDSTGVTYKCRTPKTVQQYLDNMN